MPGPDDEKRAQAELMARPEVQRMLEIYLRLPSSAASFAALAPTVLVHTKRARSTVRRTSGPTLVRSVGSFKEIEHMMTLNELIRQLENMREIGSASGGMVTGESPVMLEGHDEDDNLVQAWIDGVHTERRCEGDNQPSAVYLNLSELSIG